MREKELSEIGEVRFERLVTHLRQGIKCGLGDVTLVEVGSVVKRSCQNVLPHKTNRNRKPLLKIG
jgi:hypothetical protein